jgi:hypothetical protein
VNAQGVGLRDALDYLVRYWNEPQDWPWDDRADVPSPGPLWEIAFAHWCDARYLEIARDRRPYGSEGNSAVLWTTLTSATAGDTCHNRNPNAGQMNRQGSTKGLQCRGCP